MTFTMGRVKEKEINSLLVALQPSDGAYPSGSMRVTVIKNVFLEEICYKIS